jgi:glycolate oxidase FAD binding subunit
VIRPESSEQLAEVLRDAASRGGIRLGGAFTKDGMAGPIGPAETTVSTSSMQRVLQYDPGDLTISVEAGLPFRELNRFLAEHRQTIPLDPPFLDGATVGGVIAANCSGPRRRAYGTARDLVIGMKFATVAGKLVASGGMVVKNVAGLDMAKLMIGSFGTLAAVAVVNFKVVPVAPASRTFVLTFPALNDAIECRNRILNGVLHPAACDLLSPGAAARVGLSDYALVVQAAGNEAVLGRYSAELGGSAVEGAEEEQLWTRVREFTPEFLRDRAEGAVVRVSAMLSRTGPILESLAGPVVARAGSGVSYAYFDDTEAAAEWLGKTSGCGWKSVIEFAPPSKKAGLALWPDPGNDLEWMTRLKFMFDPGGVLNAGRMYGRL